MKSIKFLAVFIFCTCVDMVHADHPNATGRLILASDEARLRVVFINTSDVEYRVNRRFSIGPSVSPCELIFQFEDSKGTQYPFRAYAMIGAPVEEDYVLLDPGQLVGLEFEMSLIQDYFNLAEGEYLVRVLYRDKFAADHNAFEPEIKSNLARIVVTEGSKDNSG